MLPYVYGIFFKIITVIHYVLQALPVLMLIIFFLPSFLLPCQATTCSFINSTRIYPPIFYCFKFVFKLSHQLLRGRGALFYLQEFYVFRFMYIPNRDYYGPCVRILYANKTNASSAKHNTDTTFTSVVFDYEPSFFGSNDGKNSHEFVG